MLIPPRLLKYYVDMGEDFTKVRSKVYFIFYFIISFPVWGLFPLLIFFVWSAENSYSGASIWFIASLGYLLVLSFTMLRSTTWNPFPLFFNYMYLAGASYLLFVVIQLFGMYKNYSYIIVGSMWVSISAMPILAVSILSGRYTQSLALTNNHIDENYKMAYFVNIQPCETDSTFRPYFDKIIELIKDLSNIQFYMIVYSLSTIPIIIFTISSVVSGKTGVTIIALVVIVIVEICGASLYCDDIPLANVYKLALVSLTIRFVLITSGTRYWLIVFFVVISFASLLTYMRTLQVVVPDPGDKRTLADSLMLIFDKHYVNSQVESKEQEEEEEDLEVSQDEIDITIFDEKDVNLTNNSIRAHPEPNPIGFPFSALSLVVLETLKAVILLIAWSRLPGLYPKDFSGIEQISLCGLIWILSIDIMLVYTIYHIVEIKKQGGDQRTRHTMLYTIQNLLSHNIHFDLFLDKLNTVSNYFVPAIKPNHTVGFLILLTWLMSIATGVVAGWIFELWFLVPCITLMPLANIILYKFLKKWEESQCDHSLFLEVYQSYFPPSSSSSSSSSPPPPLQPPTSSSQNLSDDIESDSNNRFNLLDVSSSSPTSSPRLKKPSKKQGNDDNTDKSALTMQSVPLTQISGSSTAEFIGSIIGNQLTVVKVISGVIQLGQNLSGTSGAQFSGSWDGPTLTVKSILSGSLQTGQMLKGPDVLEGTVISELLSGKGGKGTYKLSIEQNSPGISECLSTAGFAVDDASTKITDFITGKGGKGTYLLSGEQEADIQSIKIKSYDEAIFMGEIEGNTLTVQEVVSGTISTGMTLCGTGIKAGTLITEALTGSGRASGTYVCKAPVPSAPFVLSFKSLSPYKTSVIDNWALAIAFYVVAMLLSIPSERNEVPFLYFLYAMFMFITYGAFIR